MQEKGQQTVDRVFGGLTIAVSIVWAVTMIAVAVATKASDEFIWVLLVLFLGASGSGAVVEAARRRLKS